MGSTTLRPASAGSNTNQTPLGGGTNYSKVNDDSDSTYNLNGTTVDAYVLDTYNFATPTIPSGATIDNVQVKIRFAGTASFTSLFKPCVYIGSTAYYGSVQTRTDATITEYTETWATNPADSAAWESADLTDLQIGDAIQTGGINKAKVYEVWVTINYTESSGARKACLLQARRRRTV